MIYKKDISFSFIRDVVSMYGVAAANLLLPIFFIPYASSKVGIENFGTFAVLAAFFQYGIMFVEFGTTSPLVRLLASNAAISIFWDAVTVRFYLFIIALAAIVFIAVFLLNYNDVLVFIIGAASLLGTVFNPMAIYQAKGKLPHFSLITFVSRVIVTLFATALLQFKQDLWIVFAFQFLPVFIVSIISVVFLVKRNELRVKFQSGFFKNKELSRDSISFFMGTVFSSGYTVAVPLIVNYFFGGYAAGVYGIVDRVTQPVKQIIMPIVNIIYPKVCAVRLIDRSEAIRFSVKTSLFLTGLCVLFISLALILIDYIVLYVFKNSVETQYLYPMAVNVFCVYISQILIFLFVVPSGRGNVLKIIYAWMLVFFMGSILFSIYIKSLVSVYWVLACVELLGMLLLFFISYYSVKKNSVL
ncbi:oligosaccharide flippase family protein [Tolumonas auensis]|uniref:oligosaccharide flippase family protein n=1 Tax=Tolumonas auensis TaxID=43948 RepID=UPI002AA72173|nr:oligosaccharide flippase family protein [Tolumonas auensis]